MIEINLKETQTTILQTFGENSCHSWTYSSGIIEGQECDCGHKVKFEKPIPDYYI